jgi:UDP-sulfoquinovose synthase
VEIRNVENPRKEAEDHYYNPKHTGLLELGLQPNCLSDKILSNMMQFVFSQKNNINKHQILRHVRWK